LFFKTTKIQPEMKFLELARERYSCRKYKADPVEREKLEYILEAGRVAPSACNNQPWKIFVIEGKSNLEKIYPVYNRPFFKEAPVILVICGDHELSWKRADGKDHCDVDASIITDHMTLAATDCGLATCWICNFDRQKSVEILQLPANQEPVAILTLGYPESKGNENRHDTQRKALNDIVQWNSNLKL
jgi:nitroreductase